MRRISHGGTVKLIIVALIGSAVLHVGDAATAQDRRVPRLDLGFASPYAAPTPQRSKPPKPSVDPNAAFAAKVKPGSFALVLNDGNRYIWTPAAEQKLPLETAFAKVEVPLALVASVSFTDEQGAVKVAFRNGDIVTGKLLLKELAIRTAYGDLTVPVSAMTYLGAGGVGKPLGKPLASPNEKAISGTLDAIAPPRPVPAARFDRRVLR